MDQLFTSIACLTACFTNTRIITFFPCFVFAYPFAIFVASFSLDGHFEFQWRIDVRPASWWRRRKYICCASTRARISPNVRITFATIPLAAALPTFLHSFLVNPLFSQTSSPFRSSLQGGCLGVMGAGVGEGCGVVGAH